MFLLKLDLILNSYIRLNFFCVARNISIIRIIYVLMMIADGKYCLTGGNDRTVRLWNPARLDPAYTIPSISEDIHTNIERSVGSLPRALPIQKYTEGFTHPISAIAVGEDDNIQHNQQWLLSASDKSAVLTDIVSGQAVRRFLGHTGRINSVTFSQGAETYLTASYDATVRIWDGRNRSSYEPIQVLKEAKDSVTAVDTVQRADKSMALIRTGSVDGIVRTYDLRMGVLRCDDCKSPIVSMAPTIDGQCLAVSCLDGNIRLIDCESGELSNTFHSGHIAGQYGLDCCVTANDSTLVTGSENGDTVLYDIVRADIVQTLSGHTAPTCAVTCHPKQSDVIVTTSYDGNAIVWAHDLHYMSWHT
jgi:mitogen-activated protein kinase organizer 1